MALPTHIWSEIVGLLWSVAWTDPSAPEVGRLAAQLYVAYCRASGIDPTRAADLLILLPEQLRQQVREHG